LIDLHGKCDDYRNWVGLERRRRRRRMRSGDPKFLAWMMVA